MVAPHVQGKERKSSTTLAPITDTHQCAKTPKTLQRALQIMNGLIKFTPDCLLRGTGQQDGVTI